MTTSNFERSGSLSAAPASGGAVPQSAETPVGGPSELVERDVAKAQGGDKEAFGRLVERYQGMVYTLAYNATGNHVDAEDAAQEVFLRAYRKLPGFKGAAAFSTWLFRLAVNAIVDYQRRERRSAGAPGARDALDSGDVPEVVGDLEAEVLERVGYRRLMQALADLPTDYRTPLVLRDIYGLEYEEISRRLDRPLGTVKACVHRGRNSLRLRLRGSGVLGEER
jgi:RNA polymerase sigma-70 factor (ECF subfamily)